MSIGNLAFSVSVKKVGATCNLLKSEEDYHCSSEKVCCGNNVG